MFKKNSWLLSAFMGTAAAVGLMAGLSPSLGKSSMIRVARPARRRRINRGHHGWSKANRRERTKGVTNRLKAQLRAKQRRLKRRA